MATEVKLPELGEGVTEGELVKWLVKVGDTVKPDQPVAEVMTDKATVEVPTPVGGVVKDLRFKVGDVIAVEKVLLSLEAGGASAAPAAPAPAAKPAAPTPAAAAPAVSKPASQAPAAPSARTSAPKALPKPSQALDEDALGKLDGPGLTRSGSGSE